MVEGYFRLRYYEASIIHDHFIPRKYQSVHHNSDIALRLDILQDWYFVGIKESDELKCPHCNSKRIVKIHRPEVYEFNYRCLDCDTAFDNPKDKT